MTAGGLSNFCPCCKQALPANQKPVQTLWVSQYYRTAVRPNQAPIVHRERFTNSHAVRLGKPLTIRGIPINDALALIASWNVAGRLESIVYTYALDYTSVTDQDGNPVKFEQPL